MKQFSNEKGQSLIEVIVAIFVLVILLTAAFSALSYSLKQLKFSRESRNATDLAKQLAENLTSYSFSNWNDIYNSATGSANTFYLTVSSTSQALWLVSGQEQVNLSNTTFTRYVFFDEFYRSGELDPFVRRASVIIDWATSTQSRNVNLQVWLYRNNVRGFGQSDWSGGS